MLLPSIRSKLLQRFAAAPNLSLLKYQVLSTHKSVSPASFWFLVQHHNTHLHRLFKKNKTKKQLCWSLRQTVTVKGSTASKTSSAPPKIPGTQADWRWPWPDGVKPFAQKRYRKRASLPWSPDTLRSCCRGLRRRPHSPCCAGTNRQSVSSPGSTTWSCVRAWSRCRLRSCSCSYSTRRRTPLLRPPTLPPSSSVQPYRLCPAPGPSWWSETGDPGRAAGPVAWSPLAGRRRSSDKGWLCSGPAWGHCNLDTAEWRRQTPSRGFK